MAIPKKRKKLDPVDGSPESTEVKEKDTISLVTESIPSIKPSETVAKIEDVEVQPKKKAPSRARKKHTEADVDKAFEVMEKLSPNVETDGKQLQIVRKVYTKEEAGLHICFTVDAIQLSDFLQKLENSKEEVKDYLEFDITIPYPWNWPIFNDLAKIVISNLKDMKIIK